MLSLIILAAGKSTRMLGRNKLLEKIRGRPMIRCVVEVALKSKADE
ncbi:MAG TPA: NTP transferase domain-containing protein, partial [Candidatus Bathyarchaeia archaeon]|nr:NTP transferase domain-containing protein [Candidatus Bathyarchaeia archaeon]